MFSIGLKFPVPVAKIPASLKTGRHFSEIGSLVRFQLKLQFVSGKGSEHRIPVFARYFDGETEESLRGAAGDLAEK